MQNSKQQLQNIINKIAKQWEEEKAVLTQRITQLEEENHLITELIANIKKNIIEKCSKINQFESLSREEIEKELKYLKDEITPLEFNFRETNSLKNDITNLQNSISKVIDEIEKHKIEKGKLLQTKQQYENIVFEKKEDLTTIVEQQNELEPKLNKLEIEKKAIYNEVRCLEKEVGKLEKEKIKLESSYILIVQKIEMDKIKYPRLMSEMEQLKNENEVKEKRLQDLSQECEQMKKEIEILKKNDFLNVDKLIEINRQLNNYVNNLDSKIRDKELEKLKLYFKNINLKFKNE